MAHRVLPAPFDPRELWINACTDCGTSNPTRAGKVPERCAGCGAAPVPLIGADITEDTAWAQTPELRQRILAASRRAEARRQREKAERDDMRARLALAAFALRKSQES